MIRSPKTRLLARAAVDHLEAVAKAFAKRLFLLFIDDPSSFSHTCSRRVFFEAANMEAVVVGQLRYCTGKSHSVVLGGHSTIRTPPSSLFLPPRMMRPS
jgi:hypothetical protein